MEEIKELNIKLHDLENFFMTDNILVTHFDKTRKTLLELSKHFEIVNNGTVKGNIREGVVHEFLQKNLPTVVDYLTGEIIDCKGARSGQIDIILQSISDPRIQLYKDQHIALCDAVLAVIEVKSTLTTGAPNGESSLVQALNTFKKVKSLYRTVKIKSITGDNQDKETIPCILFAYTGPPVETLANALKTYATQYEYKEEECDRFLPDVIVVLDKGYYAYKEDGWIFERTEEIVKGKLLPNKKTEETLIGMFVYLCNVIQSWNKNRQYSNYVDYLK